MILDSAAIEANIQRDLRRVPPPTEPDFSFADIAAGLYQGPAAGLLEMVGDVRDIAHSVEVRAAQEEAFRFSLSGTKATPHYIMPPGDDLRKTADDIMPDPNTTHWSAQAVAQVARFGTKYAVGRAIAGPFGGAALTGASEVNTVAQKLMAKGIDKETAIKVGLVEGGISGAGLALPVVGGTVAKTLGLIALGGPVSYMTQEAASRAILQAANYPKEANSHDPTNMLGLGIATALPALIGGVHIAKIIRATKMLESSGRRYGADGKLLTSDQGALGEMQVLPTTAKDPGYGVKPAADSSADELARVGRDAIVEMYQRYGGDTDKIFAAYHAGRSAVDKAVEAKGADWLSAMGEKTQKHVERGRLLLAADNPEVQDAARVAILNQTVKDVPDYGQLKAAMDAVASGDTVSLYHGSPHLFAEFDSSKIGTGEGAQAFGHGLYMAESPDVAAGYRDALAPPPDYAFGGKVVSAPDTGAWKTAGQTLTPEQYAALKIERHGSPKAALDALEPTLPTGIHEVDQGAEILRRSIADPSFMSKTTSAHAGNLYRVEVQQSMVERMLDWDKALSQQAPEVQRAIEIYKGKDWWIVNRDHVTGEKLTREIQGGNPVEFSSALADMGVPGIKYLDANSRDAGEGTRNYVVFPGEEKNLRIVERNNQPLKPAEPPAPEVAAGAVPRDLQAEVDRLTTVVDNLRELSDKMERTSLTTALKGSKLAAETTDAVQSKASDLRSAGTKPREAARQAIEAQKQEVTAKADELRGSISRGEILYEDPANVLDSLVAKNPDMPVRLPGDTANVTLAEAARRIAAEEADDAGIADLLRVAVECALGP